MGNHVAETVGLPSIQGVKVHARMCSQLLVLVKKISRILPEIEASRPGRSSGIDALCLLNSGIAKAKALVQNCSESSVLYLALTGGALLSRCVKSKELFKQSLSQIQGMVPVALESKISTIVAEIQITKFFLDPSEAEAGKVLEELLRQCSTASDFDKGVAVDAIHTAASQLRIASQRALLIERRSIKKMLDNLGDSERERGKKGILMCFLNLLKKYAKDMPQEPKVDGSSKLEHPSTFASPYCFPKEVELCVDYKHNETQINMLSRPVPPEEFLCPLSLRLMYDPVVIASGETYERMWILKWFGEGNVTCPKTKTKLPHLSVTANTGIKELICKWCAEHEIHIPYPPKIHETPMNSLETSFTSVASMTNSMYNLNLPVDYSNISLGSIPDSNTSSTDISKTMMPIHEEDLELIYKFSELPWKSRCNAVEDVKKLLKLNNASQFAIPSEKFAHVILGFLKDACDLHDEEAQMTGCLLLLEFVQKNGDSASFIKEDTYELLASLLDTQLSKQALSILEVLSSHKQCGYSIALSGAITGILNILGNQNQNHELLEPSLHILINLSSNVDVGPILVPSTMVPKLVTLFEDQTLAGNCVTILENLCENRGCRMLNAEMLTCIPLLVKVLEIDDLNTQEHALHILLHMCSQHVDYCRLVMDEGIFPSLVTIGVNGSRRGQSAAKELLRILRDVVDADGELCNNAVATVDLNETDNVKSRPKPSSLFGKVFGKKKK